MRACVTDQRRHLLFIVADILQSGHFIWRVQGAHRRAPVTANCFSFPWVLSENNWRPFSENPGLHTADLCKSHRHTSFL